ncbi:uncharacterized protein LOC127831037 [Dreissena polymorpha]|uniref:F-box domain-containing protein n=1 Tax=Dreissena polymorpha TaxID=45954 RepID=A0A9D4H7U2_DREPO|nr:uncharacterized protein LOC127831037 [Dreissena polymorpha]KAH3826862.1 hypothetical protein DPMN_128775 [Dreissena polymorpha]
MTEAIAASVWLYISVIKRTASRKVRLHMLGPEIADGCAVRSSNGGSIGITDLPSEALVSIFKHLQPVDDLMPKLALVCRKWHDLLYYSGGLWKTINIDPTFYSHLHFRLVVCIFRLYGRHVHTVTWRENTTVYESIFACLPALKNLKVLRVPVLWTRRVIDDMCLMTGLEKVQINGGFTMTDEHFLEIANCLSNLKTVTLNACSKLTFEGITRVVPRLKSLEDLHIKINSNLPLTDGRSETAIRNGHSIIKGLVAPIINSLVTVLCVHFVAMETEELWDVVNSLSNLRKLSISNCEHLAGIRLSAASLQKFCVFNIWSTTFVSVHAPKLRHVTIDSGMESIEHVELFALSLKRALINGSNSLRTLKIKSEKLTFLEVSNCELIEMKCLKETLRNNSKLLCLRLGCVSQDSLTLDETVIPSVQELCLLGDFSCEALHIRSPSIRLIHTQAENDIITLNHMYLTANHLCKVALVGLPALRTVTVQCVSVDCIELNLCSDDQLHLESFVVHALNAIGFLRLFDCKVNLLSLCTQLAKTVVLYRCQMSDYVLQMALGGCPNIAHLNLEKCRELSNVNIFAQPLKFLNLFGCASISKLNLDCPQLVAVNLGQCSNVRLFIKGIEQGLKKLLLPFRLVEPTENVRWTHDLPPEEYEQ